MPGIGETLREARKRQGLDITDAEAATKIRAKYLRALENEEFDLLHGATFVRSFLRTYGDFLGLDSRRLIDEYRAQFEPREASDLHPIVARPQRQTEPRGRPPGRGTVIALLAVALLGFLLVLGLTGDDETPRTGGTETSTQPTETSPRERARRRTRERRPPRPRRVSLRVSPTEATYVCVDGGRGTDVIFEGSLAKPRTFTGRRLRLNLGRTSARVRANGRAVPIEAGPAGVGFEFTTRGRRAIAEQDRPCV